MHKNPYRVRVKYRDGRKETRHEHIDGIWRALRLAQHEMDIDRSIVDAWMEPEETPMGNPI